MPTVFFREFTFTRVFPTMRAHKEYIAQYWQAHPEELEIITNKSENV